MAIRVAGALESKLKKGVVDPIESLSRTMLRARVLEDKLGNLYRAGRIVGGVYLGKGQEALSGSGGLA